VHPVNAIERSDRGQSLHQRAVHFARQFVIDQLARGVVVCESQSEWAWRVQGDYRARLLAPNAPDEWAALSDTFAAACRQEAKIQLRMKLSKGANDDDR
jgi:hypothetical protein